MNGYNFTERVRRCLAMAREEAAALRHEYVGTEHLLLGMIQENGGVGVEVLRMLDIDPAAVRHLVVESVKKGRSGAEAPFSELPYTSRAKKVLELSMTEARNFHHSYVGTEHLLLGLIAEGRGIAAMVLTSLGVTLEEAREKTLLILQGGTTDGQVRAHASMDPPRAPVGAPRSIMVVLHYENGATEVARFPSPSQAIQYLHARGEREMGGTA